MKLREFIDKNFQGSQTTFARVQGVNPQQVTRWLKEGYIVSDNTLYSPRRELTIMSKITVNFDTKTVTRFPVYCKYDGQFNPQPAFISLDLRNGSVDADYSGEIGGGLPADVWNKKVLRFNINPMTHKDEIETLINSYSEEFTKLVELYQAEEFEQISEMDFDLNEKILQEGVENFMIDDLAQWIMADGWPEPGTTLRTYVAEVAATDGENDHFFPEELTDMEYLKEAILLVWADWLYSDQDIPPHVARILLDQGTCSGSRWMDELREFAAA